MYKFFKQDDKYHVIINNNILIFSSFDDMFLIFKNKKKWKQDSNFMWKSNDIYLVDLLFDLSFNQYVLFANHNTNDYSRDNISIVTINNFPDVLLINKINCFYKIRDYALNEYYIFNLNNNWIMFDFVSLDIFSLYYNDLTIIDDNVVVNSTKVMIAYYILNKDPESALSNLRFDDIHNSEIYFKNNNNFDLRINNIKYIDKNFIFDLPKFVKYYKEFYDKKNNKYREYFEIAGHPKLYGNKWQTSKSIKINISDKYKETIDTLNRLDHEDNKFKIKLINQKKYIVFDQKINNTRYNMRLIYSDHLSCLDNFNLFKNKLCAKYPNCLL